MKKSSLILVASIATIATAAGVKQLSVPDIEGAQSTIFRGFDELERINAYVVDDKGKLLGTISGKFGSDSLGNSFGKGSTFESDGIFNPNSPFGSKYSPTSAFNPSAMNPPLIIAKQGDKIYTIGYLTTNKYISTRGQRINPNLMKAWIDSK